MMKPCTEAEFDAFIAGYPRPLEVDVTGISEPPTKSYNDFSLGKWPKSVVASVSLYESYSKKTKGPYGWEPNHYRIMVQP